MNPLLTAIGTRLAHDLATPKRQGALVATVAPQVLAATLRPGDVLLVKGNTRLRRHLLALGGGDPSRAICSTLIAEASQALHYPILPDITPSEAGDEPS